jgi:para-aminobenzoate synthetase component I
MQPIALELKPAPDLMKAFQCFHQRPGCLLFDSSMRIVKSCSHPLGRYSFLMAEPFDWIELPVGAENPLNQLRERLHQFRLEKIPDLPPMQGGYAGLLSYDLNQSLERLIPIGIDEFQLPAIAMGGYDTLIAWDHQTEQAWIISSGLPETDFNARVHRAKNRIENWLELLDSYAAESTLTTDQHFSEANRESAIRPGTPTFEVPGPPGLTSNFSAESYLATCQKCVDFVNAGDVFQVNLAQRLLIPARRPACKLFLALRDCNPAPFSSYFDASRVPNRTGAPFQIISASPERLVAVRDRVVETRPIKGTRRRSGIPMVDIQAKEQLLASAKDRAENLMIVDLMRNDLSRCCQDDSVVVTQLCELERYPSVFHLVSAVQGQLNPDADLINLIEAVFPGGSITGAPKHRAMQIIGELEPNSRGAYCGSVGYFGFDGAADFSILIRTITAFGGWWQVPVGGGIVTNSSPKQEYEETWTKAAGLLRAIEACQTNGASANSVVPRGVDKQKDESIR